MALFDNPEHVLFFLEQFERYVDIQEARLLCEYPDLAGQVMEQIQSTKDAMTDDE